MSRLEGYLRVQSKTWWPVSILVLKGIQCVKRFTKRNEIWRGTQDDKIVEDRKCVTFKKRGEPLGALRQALRKGGLNQKDRKSDDIILGKKKGSKPGVPVWSHFVPRGNPEGERESGWRGPTQANHEKNSARLKKSTSLTDCYVDFV